MEINVTLLVIMASFVVFMLLMRAIFFEPIRGIKADREAKIAGDIQAAKSSLSDYESLRSQYEGGLSEARKRAQQAIIDARQKAKSTASDTLAKAKTDANAMLEARMKELAAAREEAYGKLVEEKKSLVQLVLKKITREKLSLASQRS